MLTADEKERTANNISRAITDAFRRVKMELPIFIGDSIESTGRIPIKVL